MKEHMKLLLKAEEAAMLVLSFFIFVEFGYTWWLFFALLLLPDISMLAYFAGNRFGAAVYNLAHHKATACCIAIVGYYAALPYFLPAGIILFAHSSMDRVFGYGLKYFIGFKHTHLGDI